MTKIGNEIREMFEIGGKILREYKDYKHHICFVCHQKIEGEDYYISLSSFNMMHSYHFQDEEKKKIG